MRGTGFSCDQCHAEVVLASDVVPGGWLEVSTRKVNPFGEDYPQVVFHFCGWRCAERYAESAQPERVA